MHSALVRLQNVFGFFTTVAFSVAAVIALSVVISPQTPNAKVALSNVQVVRGRPHYYSYKKEEYAHIKFDLNADLSTLFNWNTKQVFLYIKAVYPSAKASEPPSEAVIWDAILPGAAAPWHVNHYLHPTPKNMKKPKSAGKSAAKSKVRDPFAESPYGVGIVKLDNQRPKYQITDVGGKLQNRTDAYLELNWNVQPWVGPLVWTNWADFGAWKGMAGGKSEAFDFPQIGVKGGSGKKDDLKTEKGKEGHRLVAGDEQPRRRPS